MLEARADAARRAAGIARRAKNRARVRWETMISARAPQPTNSVSRQEAETLEDQNAMLLAALGLEHRQGTRRD